MSVITYPVATSPRVFTPRSFTAALQTTQRVHASPFGGSEQAVDLLNDRWVFSLELAPRTHDEAAQVEAFIGAMRGATNTTELHHFARPAPRGTLSSCNGVIYDAVQGASSIQIATAAGSTLLAGDLIGVDGLLLQVASNCTADLNGVLVVPLVNRLRRTITGLRRASTATYIDDAGVLQTAAVDVPRFQGGQLLVEAEATNLLRHSSDITQSSWLKNGSSSASDYQTLNFPSVNEAISQPVTVDASPGRAFTFSVDLSGTPGDTATIGCARTVGGAYEFTLLPVTLTSDFVRYSVSHTMAFSGQLGAQAFITRATGQTASVVLAKNAQLETGSVRTSYIPTTSDAATRAADALTPVVWTRPTASFRLMSAPRVQYVGGYAEGTALDFAEVIA